MKQLTYILIICYLLVGMAQMRKDFTSDFLKTANGEAGRVSTGHSLGNGIDEAKTFWRHNGNIDLSCTRLELNNADVKLNGTILFNSQEVSINEMIEIERIIKLYESDSITYQ